IAALVEGVGQIQEELNHGERGGREGWEENDGGDVLSFPVPPAPLPHDARAILPQDANRPNQYTVPEQIIWDQADLIQYAEGSIVPMFGEEYAVIDTYRRRVRLPMYPYLLVDRITKLDAEVHQFRPSTMTTEYDIPFDAWYSTDGQIPWAVRVESGQCDLLLISYMGIDFQNKGERVYRLLDCTLTFLEDMPMEGQTLRYDISINSFARNGEALLFFFSYNCFVGDTMVLKMRNGVAGFFTDAELAAGKGIIHTEKELAAKRNRPKQHFTPPLTCPRTQFGRDDLLALSRGDIASVFGEAYASASWAHGRNPSLRLPGEAILMVDRISEIDPQGGSYGLGLIVSELDLEPDSWFFPCHFKDDEVMAGSLVAEGCSQLLQFYLLYLGMQTETADARFQPVRDLGQVVRTRKQIMARKATLIYRMEITEVGLSPHPYAKADVDIIYDGIVVVDFKNLGLELREKDEGRRQKVEEEGERGKGKGESVAPVEAVTSPLRHSATSPLRRPALYDDYHIEHFATGSISACFGEEYRIFEGKRIPRTPNTYLKLFNRIVEINATRGKFGGKPNLVSEYDVPVDAWYYVQNSYPVMPYAVLMEIALQPCGFLSAYLGSTLPYPDTDFFFRNLDGNGTLARDIDLRGKTISNRVTLLSSTAMPGIIIQKFEFALSADAELFYTGTAVFGYFEGQSLVDQVGLDQGKVIPSWLVESGATGKKWVLADYYADARNRTTELCLAVDKLNFLDNATVVVDGGRHGKGYVFAQKIIDPNDWFFTCHFYQDPVMPGSLGVDAIIQALQIFALEADLGAGLVNPHFTHADQHECVWVYRGQMAPDSGEMSLEIDITAVERSDKQVVVIGDASLWKNDIRIYHVKQVAIRLLGTL
ncbi:MAG TPA: 3-hydroxyacyl-[acyl-carrier-protein] dehydratase FabA, partial [Anaerolineae bacterium]|nr:3-hydroxyacyl-[acyl-carrier-protein] dehydratase FabA [Anaerolineae bacterium]